MQPINCWHSSININTRYINESRGQAGSGNVSGWSLKNYWDSHHYQTRRNCYKKVCNLAAYCLPGLLFFMILGKSTDRYIIKWCVLCAWLLLPAFCLQVSAHTWSQTVTYSGQNVSLEKIFEEIRRQTKFFVTYDPAMLEGTQPVTVDLDKVPVNDFLKAILINQPLTYTIKKTTIFIQQKEPVISLGQIMIQATSC